MAATPVLDPRALNRAYLARQLLLERTSRAVPAVVEHLIGLQAQTTHSWYLSLWTRVAGLDPEAVGAMVQRGRLVRIALMRSTIHLVTARDAAVLRAALAGMLEQVARSNAGAAMDELDLAAVAQAGRELVEEEPRTLGEIGALLAERWPGHAPATLSHAVRARVPLVQSPPRGVWGRSGAARHTTLEALTGRTVDAAPDLGLLVTRYLRAFGPATVADIQAWCGLTRLREVAGELAPSLKLLRDERDRELWDLPRAPRPPASTPAPVRFLPDFDNALLSHADRSRVISEEHRKALWTPNGVQPGTVLVDGFVRAAWRLEREGGAAELVVTPLADLARSERAEVAAEGERVRAFLAPGAGGQVRVGG